MRARPAVGLLAVLVAAGLFAFNGTVAKLLLRGGFDAPQLTTLRATGASLGLLVLCLVTPSRTGSRYIWRICGGSDDVRFKF